MLEKTLESPLDCKQIQPVHSKGDQSWVFFGRTDAKAETPILWPPHVKSWLIGKDCDAGRDWGQEEKGATKDEMVGWHHWLDGCEFGWTPGVGDGQGGLACCNSWGRKESDMTELLNWTELNISVSAWEISKIRESYSYHFICISPSPFTWPNKQTPSEMSVCAPSTLTNLFCFTDMHPKTQDSKALLFLLFT